jgi:hypothetical protein
MTNGAPMTRAAPHDALRRLSAGLPADVAGMRRLLERIAPWLQRAGR